MYKIYYLTDSTKKIRYIGLTCQKLCTRLSVHLNDKRHNPHKIRWIAKKKSEISIVQIESNLSLEEAKAAEIQYIYSFKKLGLKLLNATNGGDCSPNKGKASKNKGIYKYNYDLIKKMQCDYIPNVFGSIRISKKYNIPTSTVERYLKVNLLDT
jgi:predicted GIY-YIG superfamily endonuclease